jgi:ribonucleoside-diphosphate reductase alpha chain
MSTQPAEKRTDPRPVPQREGLTFPRTFTHAGRHPFEEVVWEARAAVITDEKGRVVFEQHGIEVPSTWSQMATNIVASKYFRGQLGSPEREGSVRRLISRVVDTIAAWA